MAFQVFVSVFMLTYFVSPGATSGLTGIFAVEIDGDPEVANDIADKYGFKVLSHLKYFGSVYEFAMKSGGRSKRQVQDISRQLSSDPRVVWVEQQQVLERSKRGRPVYDDFGLYRSDIAFNDPLFGEQWYLVDRGQTGGVGGHDMNVAPVWRKGLSGKGVVVTIVDDGVDHSHPDLKPNYDPLASTDLNDPSDALNDPTPNKDDPSNNHGTRCAGTVAAKANNSNCGVGVAFNANIGGIRLLDGTITDTLESRALSYNNQHVDIYSSSWGPKDNGLTMDGPRRYTRKALEVGAKKGRGGKGSIFVWATGNGGIYDDDCNCDGYVTSLYTLAVGTVSSRGETVYYSEVCPSTMAVVFGSGSSLAVSSSSSSFPSGNVVTTDYNGECTKDFSGTSTAAPLVAGCIALVLEANSNLTWRDMQHIVAETSVVPNELDGGWSVNGAGYHVNHKFGFGSVDCARMVEAAETWRPIQEQHRCVVRAEVKERDLMFGGSIRNAVETDGCRGDGRPPSLSTPVDRLEQVLVHVQMNHSRRGDVSIELVAPSGLVSKLLKPRALDSSSEGINFVFKTVHHWGESPKGTWTLIVRDHGGSLSPAGPGSKVGRLVRWTLLLHGVQGELKNHEKWKMSDGYLLDDGRMHGTKLELRRRVLGMHDRGKGSRSGRKSAGWDPARESEAEYSRLLESEKSRRRLLARLQELRQREKYRQQRLRDRSLF